MDTSEDIEIGLGEWKAKILAKATSVFGTRLKAEKWLADPALGLNSHRPIDLLATQAGAEQVEQFLTRLEHGTYT